MVYRIPVYVVTGKVEGGRAISVDAVTEAALGSDKVIGGAAIPVFEVSAGTKTEGGEPIKVVVISRKRAGGRAVPVRVDVGSLT
jgi:hypothetical protein